MRGEKVIKNIFMLIQAIAKLLVAPDKGILAADESNSTIAKRFEKYGIELNEENRRAYRELLFTVPGMENYISGAILFDETIRQKTEDGQTFVELLSGKNVIPGIKVDQGLAPLNDSPVEKVAKGLDGLDERMKEYYKLGAKFSKFRAVFTITDVLPSPECIKQNAEILAEYASVSQNNNIVPIVEPEVLMDGTHDIQRCFEVTKQVLSQVFQELKNKGIQLDSMILKPNMVISGKDAVEQASAKQVAELTIKCLRETVPDEVAGIVFLSGGQSEEFACETLNEINKICSDCPWPLSFSYGRALQASALLAWGGKKENMQKGQDAFLAQAKKVSLAREGKF